MPAKPNARNWSDVQTAIATIAVVGTLGLWNLFATPSKTETTPASQPTIPPTEIPEEYVPAAMPQVKIIFTQVAPQTVTLQQAQTTNQQQQKKKKNKDNNDGGGSVSVTQTRTS